MPLFDTIVLLHAFLATTRANEPSASMGMHLTGIRTETFRWGNRVRHNLPRFDRAKSHLLRGYFCQPVRRKATVSVRLCVGLQLPPTAALKKFRGPEGDIGSLGWRWRLLRPVAQPPPPGLMCLVQPRDPTPHIRTQRMPVSRRERLLSISIPDMASTDATSANLKSGAFQHSTSGDLPTPERLPDSSIIKFARFKNATLELFKAPIESTDYIAFSHVWGDWTWRSIAGIPYEVKASQEKAAFIANDLPALVGDCAHRF